MPIAVTAIPVAPAIKVFLINLFSCIAAADLAARITTSVLVLVLATFLIGPVAVFSARAEAVRLAMLDHDASLRSARQPVIPGDCRDYPGYLAQKRTGSQSAVSTPPNPVRPPTCVHE